MQFYKQDFFSALHIRDECRYGMLQKIFDIYIYIYIYIKFFLLNGIFVFNQYTFALNHIFILSFKKHISSWWKYILYVICNLFLLLCNKNIIDQNIIFYPNKIFLVQSKIFFYTMLPFSDKTEKIWSFICM